MRVSGIFYWEKTVWGFGVPVLGWHLRFSVEATGQRDDRGKSLSGKGVGMG